MSFTGKTDAYLNTVIANNGFFPELNLGEFQRVYRVPAEYETELVIECIENARDTTNFILHIDQLVWQKKGATVLSEVELIRPINLTALYEKAVFCLAKSELLKQFATIIRKAAAENLAKESEETRNYWVSLSRKATRRMMGLGNITAALI